MQVDRDIVLGRIIDEPNYSLCTPVNHEGWPRSHAIITDKVGGLQTGIDLLLEGFRRNLEILDWFLGYRIGDCPGRVYQHE